MTHEDHVDLLRGAVTAGPGVWADLGSGTGSFTVALAEILGGEGKILSVDRDQKALREQEQVLRDRFPRLQVELIARDFTTLADTTGLDGIVMANSLHYQRNASEFLKKARTWLTRGGVLVVVEYDIELPNPWVPHPVPYRRFVAMAEAAGLTGARLLAVRPSRYHRRVYSATAAAPP